LDMNSYLERIFIELNFLKIGKNKQSKKLG
jgi:hypothetical protein